MKREKRNVSPKQMKLLTHIYLQLQCCGSLRRRLKVRNLTMQLPDSVLLCRTLPNVLDSLGEKRTV